MPELADRRAAERFPVNADATCPFFSQVAEGLGTAKIKDLSMQGVGLLVSRRVESGVLLAVTLSNPAKGFARTVLVRVTHVKPVSGAFLVEGTFTTPLGYKEMATLVL